MKYQVPIEITLKNEMLSINLDIKKISEIVKTVLSSIAEDNKKNSLEIANLNNENLENSKLQDISEKSLEDVLLDFLSGLKKTKDGWDLWELKNRSVYSTIRCNVKQSTSGKSAIYYYVGRDKQLSISIHNSIIDSFLINFLEVDELSDTGYSKLCYVDRNDFPLYNEKLLHYITQKELVKDGYPSILDYIDGERIRHYFLLNQNEMINTLILPPVLNVDFYEEFLTYQNIYDKGYHENYDDEYLQKLLYITNRCFNSMSENTNNKLNYIDYPQFWRELLTEKIAFVTDNEKRFSGTKRIVFTEKDLLIDFLDNIKYKLEEFLESNGTFL